jgi:hypothetical protein
MLLAGKGVQGKGGRPCPASAHSDPERDRRSASARLNLENYFSR